MPLKTKVCALAAIVAALAVGGSASAANLPFRDADGLAAAVQNKLNMQFDPEAQCWAPTRFSVKCSFVHKKGGRVSYAASKPAAHKLRAVWTFRDLPIEPKVDVTWIGPKHGLYPYV